MPDKQKLHARNKHNGNYDFRRLCAVSPSLSAFVIASKSGQPSINFSDALAVKALNGAILQADYGVEYWDIPAGFLCPPIPGRADYIHYVADLLHATQSSKQLPGRLITGLDTGTGASCIYPILGHREYQWQFIASEIDPVSLQSSQRIIDSNLGLSGAIRLRQQPNSQYVFHNIIGSNDRIDFTMCNPPFHESLAQANQASARKRRNLGTNRKGDSKRNFGGQKGELWCKGGEQAFIKTMINESQDYSHQVLWFTSLVSNSDNIAPLKKVLRKAQADEVQVIGMTQGQKISRFIAWTFFTPQQRTNWFESNK